MFLIEKRMPFKAAVTCRFWVTAFLLSFLAGCATTPKEEFAVPEQQKLRLWSVNEKKLRNLQNWQLEGRLGLKIPGDSGSMAIEWQQQIENYRIYLDGPLGQSLAKISGNPDGVTVEASGEKHKGRTPETLLRNMTGWDLPVSSLRYWVMGVPVPDQPYTLDLNNQGFPERLRQRGWDIHYLGYKPFSGLQLPARMKVAQGEVSATLAIRNRVIDSLAGK